MKNKRDVPEIIRQNIAKTGRKIAQLRQSKNLTQEKLAYGIGIAKSYLGYIERGIANPTLETLYLIADGLDCDVKELL